MPWIKVKKKGAILGLDGDEAYDYIEVDDYGNPLTKTQQPIKQMSRTEPKIAPGIRAPDFIKGYKKPFDYHLYNRLRAAGKLKSQRKRK